VANAALWTDPIEGLARRLRDQSDLVVSGRVERTSVQDRGPGGEPGLFTLVTLDVHESLFGAARDHLQFWVHGGELGNHRRLVSGQAQYRTGENLVVFLHARRDGNFFPAGMGRGKWTVDPLSQELTPFGSATSAAVQAPNAFKVDDLRSLL